MYCNFIERGAEYARQAVKEDDARNYTKANQLYKNTLDYFLTHLKYEKNPLVTNTVRERCIGYLRRAEEILAIVDNGGSAPTSEGGGGAAAVHKPKPKAGAGKDEDPELAKLRAGLDSVIIREKPNVKWNDVAGLESAKQALQEAVILPVKFP